MSLATIVDLSFLEFANEQMIASCAAEHPSIGKVVNRAFGNVFSGENTLNLIEQPLGNDRRMGPDENVARLLDSDQAHVEGVMKNRKQTIRRDILAVPVSQTEPTKFIRQSSQAPAAGCV